MPCFPHPARPDEEICIPDLILPRYWRGWWEPWPRRLLNRVLDARDALFGPRPSPWINARVVLPPEARRDLLILTTVHSLAETLSPHLRATVQNAVRLEAGARAVGRPAAVA